MPSRLEARCRASTIGSCLLARLLDRLDAGNHAEIAGMALDVHGFGHAKEQAQARYMADLTRAIDAFERPPETVPPAQPAIHDGRMAETSGLTASP